MKISIKKLNKTTVKYPWDIYKIMRLILKREDKLDRNKEHFWIMAVSDDNKILSLELVALGTNNRVSVRAADILVIPLLKQAKGIILIHNHPSGNVEPSEKDKDLTDRLIQACKLVNILVLDHVIITYDNYYSFEKSGLLSKLEGSIKYVLSYELERQFHEEAEEAIKKVKKESKRKIKESLEKGRQEGIERGLEQTAKQMLLKRLDMQFICEMTGLSEAQINALK